MSTHEQITNNPTSAVRNTWGRNGPQGLEEPRRRHGDMYSRSPSPHASVFKKLKKNRSPSPQPRPQKEGGVFNRLGRKEPATSARSDSRRRSPQAKRTEVETRRRQQKRTPSQIRPHLLCLQKDTSFVRHFTSLIPLIMEYLVNISKRRAFWSLNEDILKITVLTTNTSYPSRKIRCICACTHQRPQRKHDQYAVSRKDQYVVLEI
ncbi:hypothetical protein Tco_0243265 [Tanacetum coccineum]